MVFEFSIQNHFESRVELFQKVKANIDYVFLFYTQFPEVHDLI